jgi:hypothetical protein
VAKAIISELSTSSEEIKDIANSVLSIKVQGIKPK